MKTLLLRIKKLLCQSWSIERVIFAGILILCLSGSNAWAEEENEYYNDTDEDYTENEVGSEYIAQIRDPFESVNRPISKFNDFVLEPVLKLVDFYEEHFPQAVRKGIRNSFRNLREPYYAVNNALEGDLDGVSASFARLTVNTFAGFGGFIDVAGDNNCLPYSPQNLSTTLGTWGVSHGYYLVLPLLGPNSFRSGFSKAVENFSDVIQYTNYAIFGNMRQRHQNIISFSYQGIQILDNLHSSKDAIRAGQENAFDFYVFARAAFYQMEGENIAQAKYQDFWLLNENCDTTARKNRLDEF
ncbi:MAG: VacJ family lipoprotein [Deltaproteobacteria bacterium]|jgi:phospholipid-binding lipoprotein MlaA|nr:VacJ family lipoprotein [Deltaproteobacteria bacterium]